MPWDYFKHAHPIGPSLKTQPGKTSEVRLWEESGLPFTRDHPQPVRVVRTQEQVTETHYRGEQK